MSDFYKIVSFCCGKALKEEKSPPGEAPSVNPAVKTLALPCSSKADTLAIIKAFEGGADAVVVCACRADNCSLLEGSRRARKTVDETKRLLEEIGLESERLELFELGTAECHTSSQAADIMISRLKNINYAPQ